MLREKLKSKVLRPLLLLAAVLALSQTASAWKYLALVKSDGSLFINTGVDSDDKRSSQFTIDLTGKEDVTLWAQPFNGDYEAKEYDHMYPSSGPVTVSGNTTISDWTRNNKYINGVTFPGGKTYEVSVTIKNDAQIESMEITVASQGGDDTPDHSSKLTLGGSWVTDWANEQKSFSKNADGSYSCTVENINLASLRFKVVYNKSQWIGANAITDKTGVEDSKSDNQFRLTDAPDKIGTAVITVSVNDSGYPTAISATYTTEGGETPTSGFIKDSILYFFPGASFGKHETNDASFKAKFSNGQEVFCENVGYGYYAVQVPAEGLEWVYFIRGAYTNESLTGGTWWDNNTTKAISYEEGKNTIELTALGPTWTECSVKWADKNYSAQYAGMPFYPAGVYGEEDFAALSASDKFYYLTGHALNNGIASPEWQMTRNADNDYVIDFTWNDHRPFGASNSCGKESERMLIRVVSYTKNQSTPSQETEYTVTDNNLFNQIPENRRHAGVRMRAHFNPASGQLSFKYLSSAGAESEKIEDVFYLPYISLVGEMGLDEEVPAEIGNFNAADFTGLTASTASKWQNSWIQYDEFGRAVTSRDGSKVYLNTQWPPRHNVMFTGSYTDDSGDHTVGINSNGLTFNRFIDSATKAQIAQMEEFRDLDMEKFNDSDEYIVYRATDFWGIGRFKIWSGWSGGPNTGKAAEWNNNWNWGYFDPSTFVGNQYQNNAYSGDNVNGYVIEAGKTYSLSNTNGDMSFAEPTYINQVYFFLNRSDANANDGKDIIYTRQAAGNARIEAISNEARSAGAFSATVDAYASGNETPKVNGVYIRVVRANESDDNTNSVSIIREGNYAGSGELLNWNADEFTQKLGELGTVTQATGAHYPAGGTFYHDAVNYPNSGWYEYVMTVKFEGLDAITVRSNPFYVAKVENTLVAGQLIRINKEKASPAFKEYDYVTYSMGGDFAYGVKVTEGSVNTAGAPEVESVTRIAAPSHDGYADSEKATWTKYVLLYARRPWMGENPDLSLAGSVAKSWTVTYFDGSVDKTLTTTTADAPLQYIVPGADIFLHDYKATLTFAPVGAVEEKDYITVNMSNSMVLRIPTPRMQQGFFETHVGYDDDAYQTVTVAAADHTGIVNDDDYTADQTYEDTRVRHLSFRAKLDMPNADDELLALIPNNDGEHCYRQTRFSGDAKLRELLADQNVRIDLKNSQETYITLAEQDLRNWLTPNEDGTGFNPIKRQLRFDFERNGRLITFFERFSETGVTFSLTPSFSAPGFDSNKAKLYRFNYPVPGRENEWKERIVLATTPDIQPSTDTSLAPDHTANVDKDHSFYAFKMGDEVVGPTGIDGDASTNALLHYSHLASDESKTFFIADSKESFPWYAEMNNDEHIQLETLMINVAHGYIFHTQRHAEFSEGGALSFGTAAPMEPVEGAPAKAVAAAYEAPSKYIAFVGPFNEGVDAAAAEIATSVEAIGSYDAPAGVAGNGFIDMLSQGNVYTVDGRCVFSGTGRVDVQPGIYVIATPKAAYKVIVK